MKAILLIVILLASCAKRVPVEPVTVGNVINGKAWAYKPSGKGYVVFAQSEDAFKDALKALGCGVCFIDRAGDLYTVEVPKK